MQQQFKQAMIDTIRNPMNKAALKEFYNARFFWPDCHELAKKFRLKYLHILDEVRDSGTPEIMVINCIQRMDEVSFEVDLAIQDQQNEGLIPFTRQQDKAFEHEDIQA